MALAIAMALAADEVSESPIFLSFSKERLVDSEEDHRSWFLDCESIGG